MQKNTETESKATYTLADVGCYVGGARGTYAIDRIKDIAREHGYKLPRAIQGEGFVTLSDYEFAGELEDEIDSFMNERYGVDGAYWGRSEQGDWGLWPIEEV